MPTTAGGSGKEGGKDLALAPETEKGTDIERETGTGTVTTVSTKRKVTNEIAAEALRGRGTKNTVAIADRCRKEVRGIQREV